MLQMFAVGFCVAISIVHFIERNYMWGIVIGLLAVGNLILYYNTI